MRDFEGTIASIREQGTISCPFTCERNWRTILTLWLAFMLGGANECCFVGSDLTQSLLWYCYGNAIFVSPVEHDAGIGVTS